MKNKKKLIEKRVVVVTGGNGTIGKAIINKFKSEGAKCFAIDVKGSYPVLKCDLLNEKELKKTFNKISSKNKITDVIHAAGTVVIGEIKNSTTEEFDENINNNLKTAFLVGKTCSSKIKRGGSLTFISSQAGLKGAKYWGIYCLSKAAILRLSETLANELAHKKIRVNAVCPGDVEGPMMKNAIKKLSRFSNKTEKSIYNNYLNNILMKRFAKPSEIADTCFYFSNSKFVTGTIALVDGGENA
tara:strand:- start:272 stop:1000 length:729 start_codon:yes stop_codon:yes gene_type:complete